MVGSFDTSPAAATLQDPTKIRVDSPKWVGLAKDPRQRWLVHQRLSGLVDQRQGWLTPARARWLLHARTGWLVDQRQQWLISSRQQALVLAADHAVTLARNLLETDPVEHPDRAAPVANEPGPPQGAGSEGHSSAAHAERLGEGFLRQCQCLVVAPVVAHQQPARTPLLNHVGAVTGCGLERFPKECLSVVFSDRAQLRARLQCVLEPAASIASARPDTGAT